MVRGGRYWSALVVGTGVLAATVAAPAAASTTIETLSSWNGSSNIAAFGWLDATTPTHTYGQTITVPTNGDSYLRAFSFFPKLPATVVFRGEVYAWDGSKPTGPNLWEGPPTHTTNSNIFQQIDFDPGHVALTPGAVYVLFASTDKDTGSGQGSWADSASDVYTDGGFFYQNSTSAADWTSQNWEAFSSKDLIFKATFESASADLSVAKAASPPTVQLGRQITYAIAVNNRGPDPADGVTLTDQLATGTTFVSASSTQGTCSGTLTVSCQLGTLAGGTSATVTVVVRADTLGVLTNTASATSSTQDPNASNNSAGAATTVVPPPFAGVGLQPQTITLGSDGSGKVKLSCPAPAQGACAGNGVIKSASKVVLCETCKSKIATLARFSFSGIQPGVTKRVRFKLSQAAFRLVKTNGKLKAVGSSRVDLQACKLEYSIVSPK